MMRIYDVLILFFVVIWFTSIICGLLIANLYLWCLMVSSILLMSLKIYLFWSVIDPQKDSAYPPNILAFSNEKSPSRQIEMENSPDYSKYHISFIEFVPLIRFHTKDPSIQFKNSLGNFRRIQLGDEKWKLIDRKNLKQLFNLHLMAMKDRRYY